MKFDRLSTTLCTSLGGLLAVQLVFAAPPATKYDPGATLDPGCSVGDTNCTVTPPLADENYVVTAVKINTGAVTLPKMTFFPTRPVTIYDKYKYDGSYDSLMMAVSAKNVSGGSISLSGYQVWINFYDVNGNTLAKPSTSTAFDPEAVSEIAVPGASVNDGDVVTWMLKLDNIEYEVTDTSRIAAMSVGFRYTDGGGTKNFGEDMMFTSVAFTPYNT